MLWTLPTDTFKVVASSRTIECLFACFHRRQSWKAYRSDERLWLKNHHHGIGRILALAFFDDISAVNSAQLFPCFNYFLPFFEVIKQDMANMLFKILRVVLRTTIASIKLNRIVSTFFLVFRLSVNNKMRVNIWHSCHARIQINVDSAIYWKKHNDFWTTHNRNTRLITW